MCSFTKLIDAHAIVIGPMFFFGFGSLYEQMGDTNVILERSTQRTLNELFKLKPINKIGFFSTEIHKFCLSSAHTHFCARSKFFFPCVFLCMLSNWISQLGILCENISASSVEGMRCTWNLERYCHTLHFYIEIRHEYLFNKRHQH